MNPLIQAVDFSPQGVGWSFALSIHRWFTTFYHPLSVLLGAHFFLKKVMFWLANC